MPKFVLGDEELRLSTGEFASELLTHVQEEQSITDAERPNVIVYVADQLGKMLDRQNIHSLELDTRAQEFAEALAEMLLEALEKQTERLANAVSGLDPASRRIARFDYLKQLHVSLYVELTTIQCKPGLGKRRLVWALVGLGTAAAVGGVVTYKHLRRLPTSHNTNKPTAESD